MTAAPIARGVSRAASLRRLHGLVRSVNGDLDLDRTLTAVCRGVVEGLGFRVAVVNLVLPGGDLEVVACEGDEDARAALLGQRGSRRTWERCMAGCEQVGDLLVDYRAAEVDEVPTWIPDLPASDVEGAWQADDALLAPLRTPRSGLLGVISVDLPEDGLRPGPDQLELLEMFAAQASVAVENATLYSTLKAQDDARARALARLAAVVDTAPVAIVELDLEGRVRLWNSAAERMFGWREQELLGQRNPLASGEVYGEQLRELRDGAVRRVTSTRAGRDGLRREVEVTSSALLDDAGSTYGYLGLYQDVTDRAKLEQELRDAAFTDPLTGLANRACFTARLAAAGRDTSIVLLDLDGFKAVNDTLGHPAGDRVLVEVARRLRAVCRDEDLVARLGGDEFVVLLGATAAAPEADAAAETLSRRLVEVLAQPFHLADRIVTLGASVGLAHARAQDEGEQAADGAGEALLRDADVAMYAAKAAGKGRARVFEPGLREAVIERTDLVQDLRAALTAHELFVRWHPVAELRTGRVVGLEALVRWQHPRRGELLPGTFVGLAEETGLIVPLGAEVLSQACRALRRWQDLVPSGQLSASVNISPVQLQVDDLVATVREVLRDSGVPPASLVLELTEDVLLRDVDQAVAVLQELPCLGVRLAVDDFGAGYSSLSYLKRLPVEVVKLDRSLLADADTDPSALALLDAVVALTRRLGLRAVAEGVETYAQWSLLQRLDCPLAQGYLLAEPLPAEDVPALLAAGYPSSRVRAGRPG